MNEIRLAHQPSTDATEQDQTALAPDHKGEIRLLDDFELVLAGGGDGVVSWP